MEPEPGIVAMNESTAKHSISLSIITLHYNTFKEALTPICKSQASNSNKLFSSLQFEKNYFAEN